MHAVRIFIFLVPLITTTLSFVSMPEMEFKAERINKCAMITVNATVEKVFPLVGPIREKEWAEGWDPEIIYSISGDAEEHMIFRTKAHAPEDFCTWAITKFNPDQHQIEYTVSTKHRIWFITVECKPDVSKTNATICYTYTGLTEEGNQLNRIALQKMFANDLREWQEAINNYLKNEKLLSR